MPLLDRLVAYMSSLTAQDLGARYLFWTAVHAIGGANFLHHCQIRSSVERVSFVTQLGTSLAIQLSPTALSRLPRVNRRTSRCTHPSVRSPSDRAPAACLPPRRGWHSALRRRCPRRPKTRSKSASCIRSPAPWRSARPR